MGLKRWKKISEVPVVENPWWTYKRDVYELPSGQRGEYNYVYSHGSSLIIPVKDDGTIILINQYRYLCDRESLEFPCGGVKQGSTHDETAWHELVEETGYSAHQLVLLSQFNPYNGVTNEMCHVYVARGLHYVGDNPDDTEEFEVTALHASDIDERIRQGVVWDGMTLAAWSQARLLMKL
jgi:ADP-ribose pyrophosphatase